MSSTEYNYCRARLANGGRAWLIVADGVPMAGEPRPATEADARRRCAELRAAASRTDYEYLGDTPTEGGWRVFLSCLAAEVEYLAAADDGAVPPAFSVGIDITAVSVVRYLVAEELR